MLTDEQEAKKYLEPHLNALLEIIEKGFTHLFTKLSPEVLVDLSLRSKASIIHDFMRAEATKYFLNVPNVKLLQIRGLFLVDLGEMQLKFKKLNHKLQPQNIPTNQVKAFMEQQPLPGFPLSTKVIAGYQTKNYNTEINCIAVVCPDGSRFNWVLELDRNIKPAIPLRENKEPDEAAGKATVKEGLKDAKIGVNKV